MIKSIVAACVALVPALVCAQPYPSRPIRVIVPTSAGSANDFTARAVGQRMTESWGQQIVIDNRAGAGGIIAHEIAAKSAPDGYTLIFSTSSGLITNPLIYKVPYDTFRDFAPVALASLNPQVLFAHPSVAAKTVADLVALAKAKPGALNCASPGNGTPNHLGCEMLKTLANINFVHVPYKGTTPAITDVVSGQMHFMLNSIPAVLPLARSGKVRMLGTGGLKRSPAAPEVPPIAETLPGFEGVTWYGVMAPASTPAPIVSKISAEIARILADPPFAQRLIELGSEPVSSTPAGLTQHMKKEQERWSRVIKLAGVNIER
jgi:tripartite-type tricarboxylate transporter receptor subunit TctC